jgi:hypothetical protein
MFSRDIHNIEWNCVLLSSWIRVDEQGWFLEKYLSGPILSMSSSDGGFNMILKFNLKQVSKRLNPLLLTTSIR